MQPRNLHKVPRRPYSTVLNCLLCHLGCHSDKHVVIPQPQHVHPLRPYFTFYGQTVARTRWQTFFGLQEAVSRKSVAPSFVTVG